jgi:hypothetical protein
MRRLAVQGRYCEDEMRAPPSCDKCDKIINDAEMAVLCLKCLEEYRRVPIGHQWLPGPARIRTFEKEGRK